MVQTSQEEVAATLQMIQKESVNAPTAGAPAQGQIVSDTAFGPPQASFGDVADMVSRNADDIQLRKGRDLDRRINPAPFAPIPDPMESIGDINLQVGSAVLGAFETLEPPILAAGGIGGAIVGAPAGIPAQALLAATGAAGADLLVETAKDLARSLKGTKLGRAVNVSALGKSPTALARTIAATREGMFDIIGAGSARAVSMMLRSGAGKTAALFSVTDQALSFSVRAGRQGINLSANELAEGGITGFMRRVVGRFPGALSKQQIKKAGRQVLAAKDNFFARVGPWESIADLGISLKHVATERLGEVSKILDKNYEDAFSIAREKIVKGISGIRTIPASTLPTQQLNRTFAAIRGALKKQSVKGNNRLENTEAGKFLTDIGVLGEKAAEDTIGSTGQAITGRRMTLDQIDGLLIRVNDLQSGKITSFDDGLLIEIKAQLKQSMLLLDNPESVRLIQQADDAFAKIAKFLETPTASKFGRKAVKGGIRKSIRLNAPGAVEDDQLAGEVFKIVRDSPQAMREMQKLVGPEKFRAMMRGYIDDVFVRALENGKTSLVQGKGGAGIDISLVKRELGLINPAGARGGAIEQGLKQAGVDFNEVRTLVEAMEGVIKGAPPDINAFIAGRVTLGGVGALRSVFTLGATSTLVGGGLPLVASGLLIVRSIGRIASSPTLIKLANGALDRSISPIAQMQAGRALFRALESQGLLDKDGGVGRGLKRAAEGAIDIIGS